MSQPLQQYQEPGRGKSFLLRTPSTATSTSSAAAKGPNDGSENNPRTINAPLPQMTEIDSPVTEERTMSEFISLMDNYTPVIPDAVTDYYLNKSGFQCDDVRVKRLLALATQKFIANMATDAFQYCKVRQSGNRKSGKDRKTVLTMEDLEVALSEYGINVKKPEYYS